MSEQVISMTTADVVNEAEEIKKLAQAVKNSWENLVEVTNKQSVSDIKTEWMKEFAAKLGQFNENEVSEALQDLINTADKLISAEQETQKYSEEG